MSFSDPSVRDLVMRYGWNSTAYQILNPGFSYWLSPTRTAVVGYVRKGRWWVAAGAPVCDASELAAATTEFAAAASAVGCRVCYVCAAERLRNVLAHDSGHSIITIGAEPVWDPRAWPAVVKGRRSLRAQLHRARNKGVTIERCDPCDAAGRQDLRNVLREWLDRHGLPPMHFLVEPNVLDGEMRDRVLSVAKREGKAVAFLVASPVVTRQGYLIEEIARGANAPNGTAELLIDAAMTELARGGATYATLGLVALSYHARQQMAANPRWFRLLTAWAHAHGRRFYHFDGLEAFRAKMHPDAWESIYVITNTPAFPLAALHAVARAFCDGSPELALVAAIGKAARQEAAWLLRPRRRA
ncbi:MAG TPA: DUF2156 domain-containing protein [Tepidisphaeraceae bacterium]|jgi:phosphatidylglycerol lysyltransferase|nr:DUF2156 domain-containing protein [Tepidisphaeraceae bacterium]